MPLTHKERGALGGRIAQEKLSPEERKERMRRVRVASAYKEILADAVASTPALTPEQIATLSTVLHQARNGGVQK